MEFVVTRGDAAKLLELIEEAFDAVTLTVKFLVVEWFHAAAAGGWDYGRDTVTSQAFPDAIRIVAFVQGC